MSSPPPSTAHVFFPNYGGGGHRQRTEVVSKRSSEAFSRRLGDGSVVSSLHCMNDPQPEGHMASYIGRRKFLAMLGGAAAGWPVVARAQQSPSLVRQIGVLMTGFSNLEAARSLLDHPLQDAHVAHRPDVEPFSLSPSRKACARCANASGALRNRSPASPPAARTRRERHAAAALPSSDMNSRRFMGCPLLRLSAGHYHTVAEERRCASQQKLRDDVADGSN